MQTPRFSVVIPSYNQAPFVGDAIQSVLEQTYPDFEIIVVDDASPDNSNEIIQGFTDPRVRLIRHEKNRGLPAARNTGMRAARGEYIALLDADDYFHPEKLAAHAAFIEHNSEVEITYNSRFDLHHSADKIRAIYRPPESISLTELVLSFPFSPSDMVLRRACIEDAGLFDESYRCGGEDLDYPCRLALAGKRFARVDRALNYRRFHTGRRKKRLDCRANDYTHALTQIFDDPRFPLRAEPHKEVELAFGGVPKGAGYLTFMKAWYKRAKLLEEAWEKAQREGREIGPEELKALEEKLGFAPAFRRTEPMPPGWESWFRFYDFEIRGDVAMCLYDDGGSLRQAFLVKKAGKWYIADLVLLKVHA